MDDESEITSSYEIFLKRAGYGNYKVYNNPVVFYEDLPGITPSVVFLDLRMPGMGGEELMAAVGELHPNTSVFIVSGTEDVETAVRCIQNGALDYVVKPIDKDRFQTAILKGIEIYDIRAELVEVKNALGECVPNTSFSHITTRNQEMMGIFRYIESVGPGRAPVLIVGETGTGKELIAEAVHKSSGRKGELVPVNVSALDENMFNDTLFGHVKGAFTGAEKERKGLLSTAESGTVFLDEIGDLKESSQIKLLRVLQNMEYSPLGADKPLKTNARIVAATNADLEKKVADGSFRQDLFYRLSTHKIVIPPLRKRTDDLELLFTRFYDDQMREREIVWSEIPFDFLSALKGHPFPGNVRELISVVSDYVAIFKNRKPGMNELKKFLAAHNIKSSSKKRPPDSSSFAYEGKFPTLKEMEAVLVDASLELTGGNQSRAAGLLGISRQALNKRLKDS